ncbi:hypothetical protein HFN63_29710 [Rhizobium leguminosarum]|uniref:hypothetical protein n=1 Tax=Rhizobium leguminosarum TaxID=384 RepID=UPI001C97C00D|nr:hypothetical protein [Rhizobium leguminosarum]MBY5774228.1 hypothetical protein [Rhizobium leguminosarum]
MINLMPGISIQISGHNHPKHIGWRRQLAIAGGLSDPGGAKPNSCEKKHNARGVHFPKHVTQWPKGNESIGPKIKASVCHRNALIPFS